MKLGPLASAAGLEAGAASEAEVTGFAIDHRKVAPGNVFGAFEGTVVNGEDFIPAAVAGGAVAVVARPEAPVEGAAHLPTLSRAGPSRGSPRSSSSRPRAPSSR